MKRRYAVLLLLFSVPVGVVLLSMVNREPAEHGEPIEVSFAELKPLQDSPQLKELIEGGQKSVRMLEHELRCPGANSRYKAAWALGEFGANAKTAVPALVLATSDENPNVRFYAIQSVDKIGVFERQTVLALVKSLGDTNGSVSLAAADILDKLESTARGTELESVFANEPGYSFSFARSPSPTVRIMGVDRLGTTLLGNAGALAMLHSLANDAHEGVSARAKMYLRRSKQLDAATDSP